MVLLVGMAILKDTVDLQKKVGEIDVNEFIQYFGDYYE
jgi:hypothetical protein